MKPGNDDDTQAAAALQNLEPQQQKRRIEELEQDLETLAIHLKTIESERLSSHNNNGDTNNINIINELKASNIELREKIKMLESVIEELESEIDDIHESIADSANTNPSRNPTTIEQQQQQSLLPTKELQASLAESAKTIKDLRKTIYKLETKKSSRISKLRRENAELKKKLATNADFNLTLKRLEDELKVAKESGTSTVSSLPPAAPVVAARKQQHHFRRSSNNQVSPIIIQTSNNNKSE